MVEAKSKSKAFDSLLKDINKKFDQKTGTVIAKLKDRPINIETISTGSLLLDLALGGGFAKGRVIEIYGPEASGKTSFSLTAAGEVQKDGGNAVLLDLENAFDPRYAKKLGVNVEDLAVVQSETAERSLQIVKVLAESGIVDLIIVDSIAALIPEKEAAGEIGDQNIGLRARLLSSALPQLAKVANESNTTIIFINQTREKVGVLYGSPETTTGGKAMGFYASQRVRVSRLSKKITDKDGNISGNLVKFKVIKNKIAPPFKEGETILTFGFGVDKVGEVFKAGVELGAIDRPTPRKYIEVETGEVIGNSRAEAEERVMNDPDLVQRLSEVIKEKFSSAFVPEKKASIDDMIADESSEEDYVE